MKLKKGRFVGVAALFALFAVQAGSQLFGFGATGHRVIARIAEKHLTEESAAAVEEILGKETLVDVANWPDFIRSDPEWRESGPWHYVNIPDGELYEDAKKNPAGDAYAKVNEFIETLKDEGATKEEKAIALKWIVHLVGDLHQPLHVGRAEDRGGNSTKAVWFGRDVNMHSVWDSELIESTKYSFSEMADTIDNRVDVAIEAGPEPRPILWLEESFAYRDRAYETPEPNMGGTYRYIYDNIGLQEARLKQAGLRLALTLNYVFGESETWEGMPLGLHWMRNAAEYPAVTRQVFQLAALKLQAMKQEGKLPASGWAVSVDADETLLDNSLYAMEGRGSAFDAKSWDAWCRRAEAPAVPGALEFVKTVKELGGYVAVVTNRSVATQAETEKNLKALGFDFDVVLMKDGDSKKAPRWKMIEKGTARKGLKPLAIVMYLGDNIHDFPESEQALRSQGNESRYERFGETYFVLPNPTYGSWERNERR